MTKIAVIVGSAHKDSINLKLAKAVIGLGKGKFDAQILTIADLPIFNEDLEKDFPAQAARFKSEIDAADGVLFVTPEYNRSTTPLLLNAIAWASRPYGKNSFSGKPAGLIGTSGGQYGTAVAQNGLKHTLSYLGVALMGQPEVYFQTRPDLIDDNGAVTSDDTKKFLTKYTDALTAWIETHAAKKQSKAA